MGWDFMQVAHPSVRDQLVGYIINGFLVPVLGPALHKVSPIYLWDLGMLGVGGVTNHLHSQSSNKA